MLALTLTLLAPVHAQAQAPAPEPGPHGELIDRFRAAEDDEAIQAAWRDMHEAMTDAEIKAALAGRPTDDGTLRADLTLLAPDLDLMPTGDEGPGDFQWVRLVAEMRRGIEAIEYDRRWDTDQEHWHTGFIEWLRDAWAGLVPKDDPYGMALHHLVAVAAASGHPQLWNDGIPFDMHVWNSYTGMSIVERVMKTMDRPRVSDSPEADFSWADRGLVWLINALVTAQWFGEGDEAFGQMLGTVSQNEVEQGWIGGFHVEPPAWDEMMGRFAWEPIEALTNETEHEPASSPKIDWEAWAGTGLCLVRIQRDPPWNWQGPTQELIEQVAVPTLVLIPNHGLALPRGSKAAQVGVYLLLPGVRPMAFGTFDLPQEDAE